MNIEKAPANSFSQFSEQLEQATRHVEGLGQKYRNKREVSAEIERAVYVLASCNESLKDKKFTPDQKMKTNISNLLAALSSLHPLNNDKSVQEKVNALQTGLFSTFLKEFKRLEENLKGDKWKLGQKVKESEQTKKN